MNLHGVNRAVVAILLAVLAAPAVAGGWEDSPLGKAKFGEVWSGPAVQHRALAGKVVLVKHWADW